MRQDGCPDGESHSAEVLRRFARSKGVDGSLSPERRLTAPWNEAGRMVTSSGGEAFRAETCALQARTRTRGRRHDGERLFNDLAPVFLRATGPGHSTTRLWHVSELVCSSRSDRCRWGSTRHHVSFHRNCYVFGADRRHLRRHALRDLDDPPARQHRIGKSRPAHGAVGRQSPDFPLPGPDQRQESPHRRLGRAGQPRRIPRPAACGNRCAAGKRRLSGLWPLAEAAIGLRTGTRHRAVALARPELRPRNRNRPRPDPRSAGPRLGIAGLRALRGADQSARGTGGAEDRARNTACGAHHAAHAVRRDRPAHVAAGPRGSAGLGQPRLQRCRRSRVTAGGHRRRA